jgi:hypothetical protein
MKGRNVEPARKARIVALLVAGETGIELRLSHIVSKETIAAGACHSSAEEMIALNFNGCIMN